MKRKQIRVAYVMHVMQVAGAEVLVSEIIRRSSGHLDPVIVCLDEVGALGEQLQGEGVPVEVLGREPGLDLRLAQRLGSALRRHRPHVVHAHQYTPFFYAAASRLIASQPSGLIFTEHGRHFPDVVSRRRKLMNRLLFSRLATEINACSRFSGRALSEVDGFPAHRVEVIENGIAIDRYGLEVEKVALREKLGWSVGSQVVICVARFHPVKDHVTLLEAFRRVKGNHPRAELVLVGDGPERSKLEGLIRSAGLESSVSMPGIRSDISDLLAASDVFAMTSLSEAASLTILEAMASRLPVVVTDVGGNPEMVRHGQDGFLVPRGDAAAAAEAIAELLDSRTVSSAMGESARNRVEDRYDLDLTVARHMEVYDRIASSRGEE